VAIVFLLPLIIDTGRVIWTICDVGFECNREASDSWNLEIVVKLSGKDYLGIPNVAGSWLMKLSYL